MKKLPPIPIIIVCVIGIPLFLYNLIFYYFEEYSSFVSYGQGSYQVYVASGLRFICRLGYVVSFLGLARMERWGFFLCTGIWLFQLLSSMIYTINHDGSLERQLYSAGQLGIYFICVLPFWKSLKSKPMFKPLIIFFVVSVLIHTIGFLII